MATLIAICSGRQKRMQKKGAKSHDGQEDLRNQRKIYENGLRRNRREKILEDKRQVLRKLNWTVTWSDSEDDESDPQLNPNDLLGSLSVSCQMLENNLNVDMSTLVGMLDLVRKTLDKELKARNLEVVTMASNKPGPFSVQLIQKFLPQLIRLLAKCSNHGMPSSYKLNICRLVSTILSKLMMRRYDLELKRYPNSAIVLSQSLATILADELGYDLLCFTNAFNILNQVSNHGIERDRMAPLMDLLLIHLSRAATVYGPQDDIIYSYIQSLTLFLSTLVRLILKRVGQVDATIWTKIFLSGESLIRLNDDQVTENFLVVAGTFSSIREGANMLFEQQNLLNLILELILKGLKPNLIPPSMEIVSNMTSSNEIMSRSLAVPDFISRMISLMNHENTNVEFHAVQILVNLTYNNSVAAEELIENQLLSAFDDWFCNLSVKSQMKVLELVERTVALVSLNNLMGILTQTKVFAEIRTIMFWHETEFVLLATTVMHALLKRLQNTQWMAKVHFLEMDFKKLYESSHHEVSSLSALILEQFFGVLCPPKTPTF